jgi:hypothetical protein
MTPLHAFEAYLVDRQLVQKKWRIPGEFRGHNT